MPAVMAYLQAIAWFAGRGGVLVTVGAMLGSFIVVDWLFIEIESSLLDLEWYPLRLTLTVVAFQIDPDVPRYQ